MYLYFSDPYAIIRDAPVTRIRCRLQHLREAKNVRKGVCAGNELGGYISGQGSSIPFRIT